MPSTGSRRPGRPPAAKADETRKRILQAARLVFSERGYDGATFQAIAVRADLTRPAINHYFPSKRVLVSGSGGANQRNWSSAPASNRPSAKTTLMGRLTAFISAAVRANSENPSASAFLITDVLESQRHPELNKTENDSVRISREFLITGRQRRDRTRRGRRRYRRVGFGRDAACRALRRGVLRRLSCASYAADVGRHRNAAAAAGRRAVAARGLTGAATPIRAVRSRTKRIG